MPMGENSSKWVKKQLIMGKNQLKMGKNQLKMDKNQLKKGKNSLKWVILLKAPFSGHANG
jgi:hypothetical protein